MAEFGKLRIVGIDPGLVCTGYGVVDFVGPRAELVEGGLVRGNRGGKALSKRLEAIYSGIREVLDEFRPELVVLEEVFSHVPIPRTAILMGHARGVICLAAAQCDLPVVDMAATQVKHALTGHGRAGKEQIERAVADRLGLEEPLSSTHVADALALAIAFGMVRETRTE